MSMTPAMSDSPPPAPPAPPAPAGERRQPTRQPLAPPLLAVELADADDFRRLIERHARLCVRDGMALAALSLHLRFDGTHDPSLRQHSLSQCLRRLRHQVRATDTLAHWPATHFGVLLPRCSAADAQRVLYRLIRAASGTCRLGEHTTQLLLQGQVVGR